MMPGTGVSESLTELDIQEDIFSQVPVTLVGLTGTAGGLSGICPHLGTGASFYHGSPRVDFSRGVWLPQS